MKKFEEVIVTGDDFWVDEIYRKKYKAYFLSKNENHTILLVEHEKIGPYNTTKSISHLDNFRIGQGKIKVERLAKTEKTKFKKVILYRSFKEGTNKNKIYFFNKDHIIFKIKNGLSGLKKAYYPEIYAASLAWNNNKREEGTFDINLLEYMCRDNDGGFIKATMEFGESHGELSGIKFKFSNGSMEFWVEDELSDETIRKIVASNPIQYLYGLYQHEYY